MKLSLVVLILGCALASGVAAQSAPVPATGSAAAPYIIAPGVKDRYLANGHAIFTAGVYCAQWKAIVQFTAGTGGQRYHTRTIYVCDSKDRTTVRFTITPAQVKDWPAGNYQFTIKVGRYSAKNGQATRWTDSDSGSFIIG